jgi:hypothetical protein
MGREESPVKRSNKKRHRPKQVVAKLRQADEALAKGTPIAEVARPFGGVRGDLAPLAGRIRRGGAGRERHRAPKGDEDIVTVLDELTAIRGASAHIRADNGPEALGKVTPTASAAPGTQGATTMQQLP